MSLKLDISNAVKCSRAVSLGRGWAIGLVYVEFLLVLIAFSAEALIFPLLGAILIGIQTRLLFKYPRIMIRGEAVRKLLMLSLIFAFVSAILEEWSEEGMEAQIGFALLLMIPCGIIFRYMRKARPLVDALEKAENSQALEHCFFASRDHRFSLWTYLLSSRLRPALPSLVAGLGLLGIGSGLSMYYHKNFVIFAVIPASYLLNRARRHLARSADEVRSLDTRPPILILRSFQDDTITTKYLSWGERFSLTVRRTFEQIVAKAVQGTGPPVLIGDPHEPLPRLGASRQYADDDDWQSVVASLMDEAACLLFLLGDTANFFWEFQQALERKRESDSLIIIPPLKDRVLQDRWQHFVAETAEAMHYSLPQRLPHDTALAVFFQDGIPVFISGRKRTIAVYRLVLRLFLSIRNEGISSHDELVRFVQEGLPLFSLEPVQTGDVS